MTEGARRVPLLNQLVLLIMGVLVVYLMVDFFRQVASSRQRQDDLREAEALRDVALAEQERLKAEASYAQSEEAAEEWARLMGWAKDNEQTVVIVPSDAESPSPEADQAGAKPSAATQREAWWKLFFGSQ
jgi:cell division protein FtsB